MKLMGRKGGLGVANSMNTKKIFWRIEKENELCPNDTHEFGKWGEWHGRWQKAGHHGKQYVQTIRRRCKKCGKTAIRTAWTEAGRERIDKELLTEG
jgi:hypothetical protein